MTATGSIAPLYTPFTAPPSIEQRNTAAASLARPRTSLKWNWLTMDLDLDGAGRVPKVQGAEAHAQWCLRTLLTERFAHIVYTHQHGVEFDSTITGGRVRAVVEALLRRSIGEALRRHPDTISVAGIAFRWNGDELFIDLVITSRAALSGSFNLGLVVSGGGA